MASPVNEHDDIQGLIKSGYPALTEAAYLLLRVTDRAAARDWLRQVQPTTIGHMREHVSTVLQVAVSAEGLRALGLPEGVIAGFSDEFVSGMAGAPARSRRLGDVGENAPERWAWGGGGREPHVLVVLLAMPDGLPALISAVTTPALQAAFEIQVLTTVRQDGYEPFGFRDGLSQPSVDLDGKRTPGGLDDIDYGNEIAAGEILLGYPNEYGLLTSRPLADPAHGAAGLLPPAADVPGRHDLGRNGSYLVFRQLEQDVEGFWRFVEANGGQPLAEAMVGRRKSGEPLVPTGERPIRGVDPDEVKFNGFDFSSDNEGLACPYTGHVRRANPRTGDIPGGNRGWLAMAASMIGIGVDRRADTIASSRFHRLLRRGRKYELGPESRGLHFICLCASIVRQFEFVQGAWLASPKFAGLTGEQDPLLGARNPFPANHPADSFRWPQATGPCREIAQVPQFVTVRGGAYFFLPGVRALRYIAEAGTG